MTNKILIITCDNRAIKLNTINNLEYNDLSFYINSSYCHKHGYEFKYFRMIDLEKKQQLSKKDSISSYSTKSKLTKSPSWTKLLVIYQNFSKKNDYIIYLDTDCIFNNHKIDIKNYIERMEQKKKIGLVFNDGPWDKKLPNCGFIILKNCEFNKRLIKKWWNSFSLYNHVHPYEQKIFQKLWSKNYMGILNKFFLENISLQGKISKDKILAHITSERSRHRKKYMRNFIVKNLKFHNKIFNNFILNNQRRFCPSIAEEKINRKINFFDLIIIKIHRKITLNILYYLKKIKKLKFFDVH